MPYVAVYRSSNPPPDTPLLIHEGDIRLAQTPGPLSFSYSVPIKRFGPGSVGMTLGKRSIDVPRGSYVTIETLTSFTADSERERVVLAVAEAASLVTLRYPYLLEEKLFEGVVSTPNSAVMWMEGPITLTAAPSLDPQVVHTTLQEDFSVVGNLGDVDRSRLQLASRWFRRGHEVANQVDKLLFWWTVLEVYPAMGTKHVARETARLLRESIYLDMTESEVKKKLELGPMHSMRGRIVHNGQAFVQEAELDKFSLRLEKLRATVTVCLRLLGGLSPGDGLDRFVR